MQILFDIQLPYLIYSWIIEKNVQMEWNLWNGIYYFGLPDYQLFDFTQEYSLTYLN